MVIQKAVATEKGRAVGVTFYSHLKLKLTK